MKAVLMKVGQSPEVIETDGSLDSLQALVGGFIELVRVQDADLWCNEEGKLRGLEANRYATAFAYVFGGIAGDVLCGDCVVCGHTSDGDTADVPEWVVEHLALGGA